MNMFEKGPDQNANAKAEDEKRRAVFLTTLDSELAKLAAEGRLSEKEAKEKRDSAETIDVGFSKHPEWDARLFAIAGIATEEEMLALIEQKPK